jgi:hypothetical protein
MSTPPKENRALATNLAPEAVSKPVDQAWLPQSPSVANKLTFCHRTSGLCVDHSPIVRLCVKKGENFLRIDTRLGAIAPIMSTPAKADKLDGVLFGKSRRALLSLLFRHPDESYYLRQLARMTGLGIGALHRELKALSKASIVSMRVQGR